MGEVLGVGSYGMVVAAESLRAYGSRQVAIKLVEPRKGEEPIVMREGLVLSMIDSPYVSRCYDYGLQKGIFYMIMEYIGGPSLHDVFTKAGRLPVGDVCQIGMEILEALHAVHNAGFVYRDVKPQNVVKTYAEGQTAYRLIDFGSATGVAGCLFGDFAGEKDDDVCTLEQWGEDTMIKLRSVFRSVDRGQDGSISPSELYQCFRAVGVRPTSEDMDRFISKYDTNEDGSIQEEEFYDMFGELVASQDKANPAGTYQYMSPEQLLGQRATVSSDVYSLGVTMFKLAAGRPPYEREQELSWRPGVSKAVEERESWKTLVCSDLDAKWPTLNSIDPEIPKEFSEIVARCMEKRAENRFSCVTDVQAAIGKISAVPAA